MSDGFVKDVQLVRFQIPNGIRQTSQQFFDERFVFADLRDDALAFTLDGDFQKRIARHVLHPRVGFVHKLEEFIHHSF